MVTFLLNSLLRRAHIWVSCSIDMAAKLQFMCTAMLPQGKWRYMRARHPAGKPNFDQDMEQRARATFAGEPVPARSWR